LFVRKKRLKQLLWTSNTVNKATQSS